MLISRVYCRRISPSSGVDCLSDLRADVTRAGRQCLVLLSVLPGVLHGALVSRLLLLLLSVYLLLSVSVGGIFVLLVVVGHVCFLFSTRTVNTVAQMTSEEVRYTLRT